MIRKLSRWVWVGAWVLAFVAGMVNVVGLLGFEHQAVSHLTATTSRLSVALVEGDLRTLLSLGGVVGAFFGGALFSGWLIKSSSLQLGRHYTSALLIESLALALATVLLQRGQGAGVYLCSFACGLQNAMASTYSGAIIRTTHMTGLITDLGISAGQWLRGLETDWRRRLLLSLLLSGFFLGGACSALLFARLGYTTLLLPTAITTTAALLYRRYQRRHAHDPRAG